MATCQGEGVHARMIEKKTRKGFPVLVQCWASVSYVDEQLTTVGSKPQILTASAQQHEILTHDVLV